MQKISLNVLRSIIEKKPLSKPGRIVVPIGNSSQIARIQCLPSDLPQYFSAGCIVPKEPPEKSQLALGTMQTF